MTIKYESSTASMDSAFLELGVGSTADGGELYALKGLALPPADFLKEQKYVSSQDSCLDRCGNRGGVYKVVVHC